MRRRLPWVDFCPSAPSCDRLADIRALVEHYALRTAHPNPNDAAKASPGVWLCCRHFAGMNSRLSQHAWQRIAVCRILCRQRLLHASARPLRQLWEIGRLVLHVASIVNDRHDATPASHVAVSLGMITLVANNRSQRYVRTDVGDLRLVYRRAEGIIKVWVW
jgi:hypothetical protein